MVINPRNGKVIEAKVFDTYKTSFRLEGFLANHIPEGSIVCAACKDECAKHFSPFGKNWFENIGSKEVYELGFRSGWSFIGIAGRK